MSVDNVTRNRTFFARATLDDDLPLVNREFWDALIDLIDLDRVQPRAILDVGCHSGGLLHALYRRFSPLRLLGIEPLAAARSAASLRLADLTATVTLFDSSEWGQVPAGAIDLITSHEVLYLEPDLGRFMGRIRRALTDDGVAYIVLGSHAENPLWQEWKKSLISGGHCVYDHRPLEVMKAASASGLLPSVQPLRRSGWITYDPLRADFSYPDVQTMFDHHYRHKLVFRLRVTDERTTTA